MRRAIVLATTFAALVTLLTLVALVAGCGGEQVSAPPAVPPSGPTAPAAPEAAKPQGADAGAASETAPLPGAPPPPPAPPPAPAPTNPLIPELKRVTIHGYINPSFVVTSRSDAVPRDRLTIGMISSRSGLRVSGEPYERWSYAIHVGFEAAVVNNRVASAAKLSTGGDGFTFITAVPIEEAVVNFHPIDGYIISAGHQRVPFSVGHSTTITAQMFPTRPGPTSVFMTGVDDGIVNTFVFLEERIRAYAGLFNGSSLGLQAPSTTTTSAGPVWSVFLDLQPLGRLPPREGDQNRGPFRFGGGVGVLYRSGTLYDNAGLEATRFRDVRLSTAIRASYQGLFVQAEYLRRLQTDELSSRPASATGAYAQASYFLRVLPSIGLGPLARYGISVQDQSFLPQTTQSFEAGVAFYPHADLPDPDVIRLIAQYLREVRTPSGEISNGGVLHLQMRW